MRDHRVVGRVALIAGLALAAIAVPTPAVAFPLPVPDRLGVVGWGANGSGQLGDRSTQDRLSVVEVPRLTSGAAQVAAGDQHSLVLKSDGTVWAWGDNFEGKLGDNTTIHRNAPVQVVGLTGAVQVAAGSLHSLALLADGTVWSWGGGSRGQLGGTWSGRLLAAPVPDLADVVQIAAGGRFSLALLTDRTVRAWGDNTSGQLGDGFSEPASNQPVQPARLTGVNQVAAGFRHSLACEGATPRPIRGQLNPCAGALWVWGENADGQLGDGTRVTATRPKELLYVSGVRQLTAGFSHSALLIQPYGSDRDVLASGANRNGQLGNGTTTGRTTFKLVPNLADTRQVAAGDNHTVAVRTVEPVICCG